MRRLRALVSTAALIGGLSIAVVTPASADPSADDWYQLRMCESTNRYDINTGNGYYGAYQFDLPTWRSVGGTGLPSDASPAEQDYRALILYRQRGWSPWVCARLVGLTEDSDARSGVLPPVPGNAGGGGGGSEGGGSAPPPAAGPPPATGGSVPAYPGRQFREGDSSESLKAWQRQMGTRGYPLTGTGFFGPKTKAAVLDLQAKAGLNVVGFIGPKTWAAAWSTSGSPAPAPAPAPAGPSTPYVPATDESCSVGAATAPAWPEQTWEQGDTARELQCFQRQLARKGYGLTGTGYYGPATKAAVVDLQERNGINPSGIIGPKTWVAAWEGA